MGAFPAMRVSKHSPLEFAASSARCFVVACLLCFGACKQFSTATSGTSPQVWEQTEITLTSQHTYTNPYTDVEVYADFRNAAGRTIRRPAFWDGGTTWRVRFAPPAPGLWEWRTTCSETSDAGLHAKEGTLSVGTYTGGNALIKHGLLRMSPGHRNVVHADGTPFILVGDTAWSLPWRGTTDAVTVYARDRQGKGFDAVLVMSLCPDRGARGPRDRVSVGGFDVAFEDLTNSHLNQINIQYFQYMDELMSILVEHGIVPVYQPVFQGYGWKGLSTLGRTAVPAEYARYCRYLVARFGARPAMWLVGADGTGREPCVEAGGKEVHTWDAYGQPTGIHYGPQDRVCNAHQDADWLDFQWCQTGHGGAHNVSKVSVMHDNLPTKAAANGEPTYEGIARTNRATGWWQGNEAWSNLTAGGTMGVVYGVAALWQWKLFPDEPGWPAWALDPVDWRQALNKEGSRYVGFVHRAFADYDFLDITKHADLAGGAPCAAIPGKFYVVYLENGGAVSVSGLQSRLPFRWFNPRTGVWVAGGRTSTATWNTCAPGTGPWVLFVGQPRSEKR